jgi:hypothetical protein
MTRWTPEFMDKMRTVGDPLADDVVNGIYRDHGVETVNALMLNLVQNDQIVTAGMPPAVLDYLSKSAVLPTWADPQKLARGSDLFCTYGLEIVFMLFCSSLPYLYANSKGQQVLMLTRRMTDRLHRRIVETAQFVLDVTAPGGFEPNGHAIRTTQKVRLLHAAIRHFIERVPEWEAKWKPEWGIPINQTDLAGTMISFSTLVVKGLRQMGLPVSHEDAEAYLHLWQVVGHILGIDQEMMPTDYKDSVDLMHRWARMYHAPSEGGRELTGVMISLLTSLVDTPVSRALIIDWVRFWCGGKVSNMLGVAPYNWAVVLQALQIALMRFTTRLEDSTSWAKRLTRTLQRNILLGLLDIQRGDNRSMFTIPEHLRDQI